MDSFASKVAGALIFVGASVFLVGMIIAEAYYPGYSASRNFISDLGATCRGSGPCAVHQPSATVFNASASLFGLLIIISAFFIWRAFKPKILTGLVTLTGIGVLGVGLFPESAPYSLHTIFSFIAFFFAGLSALASYKIARSPFSYFSIIMGAITLVALALYVGMQYAGLGPGGMERMIAYPAIIFGIGFGGYLMGRGHEASATPPAQTKHN